MSKYTQMWVGYLLMLAAWLIFIGLLIFWPEVLFQRFYVVILLVVAMFGLPLLYSDLFACPECGESPAGRLEPTANFGLEFNMMPPKRQCDFCGYPFDQQDMT